MNGFAAALLLVPLADQALKLLLRRGLGTGSVPLGRLGTLRIVPAQIWLARPARRLNLGAVWTVWLLAAVLLAVLSARVPSWGWCAGLLLGGAFSHAFETSLRGHVCDYVCLRFWPAFNLADVAITAGAAGLAWNVLLWPLSKT